MNEEPLNITNNTEGLNATHLTNATNTPLDLWLQFNTTTAPDKIQEDLRYYFLSVQAITYLGLPVACSGLAGCIIVLMIFKIVQDPLKTTIYGYVEIVADLILILVELSYKRYFLLSPMVLNFRDKDMTEANAFSPEFKYGASFNPLRNATVYDCFVLSAAHNFINTFRANFTLFLVCSRIGFYSLQNSTMTSILSIGIGGIVSLLTTIVFALPVIMATDLWRVWNVTMCGFHPHMSSTIHDLLAAHQVFYCYGFITFILVFLIGQGLISRNSQIKRSIGYLQVTFPQYTFMGVILERIKRRFEAARDTFYSLMYYARVVAMFKLVVASIYLYYFLMYKASNRKPMDYVHYYITKNTVENLSCLCDVIVLSAAPIWWYCNNSKVRAQFWKIWCCCCMCVGCSCSAVMPPTELVDLESKVPEELEDIDERVIKKILGLRNRLLGRMMDVMTWETIESFTAKQDGEDKPM